METRRVPCVGAVVVHAGRLLLVRRGQEPGRGLWSVPGGRLEPGETVAQGCAREVLEETGVRVVPGALVGTVERAAPDGSTYVIDDLDCTVADDVGTADGGLPLLRAGDDADDAAWASLDDLDALPLVPLLRETLEGWGVLDRLGPRSRE
ncbi:MAG: NUDIX domain-containing protein [Candidatus Nanopelagicales bacterium]